VAALVAPLVRAALFVAFAAAFMCALVGAPFLAHYIYKQEILFIGYKSINNICLTEKSLHFEEETLYVSGRTPAAAAVFTAAAFPAFPAFPATRFA